MKVEFNTASWETDKLKDDLKYHYLFCLHHLLKIKNKLFFYLFYLLKQLLFGNKAVKELIVSLFENKAVKELIARYFLKIKL